MFDIFKKAFKRPLFIFLLHTRLKKNQVFPAQEEKQTIPKIWIITIIIAIIVHIQRLPANSQSKGPDHLG